MSETERERQIAGRYQLNSRVGQGAMGVVWHGYDEQLHRVVAVKQLLVPDNVDEEKAARAKNRAMREARLAARLEHPNAIRVYDAVEEDGQPWLVMEYLSSRSLATVIAETGPLPPQQVAAAGWQIASALAAAHRNGILHRDVKPANILVGDQHEVKITDFGISRATDDVTATATGTVGTPAFFSPEVARGDDAGFPSDVYSLGATLYTAVEGTPPYGYLDNSIAMLHKVASGEYRAPEKAGALEPVLTRLLESDPAARPTMDEAVELLAAVVESPPPTLEMAPEKERRKAGPLVTAAVVVLLLIIGGVAAWVWWPERQPSQAGPQSSSSQPPAPASETQSQPTSASQPASTPPATTTTPPVTTTPPPAPQTALQALTSYYSIIPGDLTTGWSRLTERFKQGRGLSFEGYQSFWATKNAVRLSNVTPQGDSVVSATVTYYFKDGHTEAENHTYTLVQQNGQWLIDNQS